MALIVEGTTSKDITVAKPTAKKQTVVVKATPTTPEKVIKTNTLAPTPVATVSKSTGGVKSTTKTPTAATLAATPNITPQMPSQTEIAQGVKENLAQKIAASEAAEAQTKTIQTLKEAQSAQLGAFGNTDKVVAQTVRDAVQLGGMQATSEQIVTGSEKITNLMKGLDPDVATKLLEGTRQPINPVEVNFVSSAKSLLDELTAEALKNKPTQEQQPDVDLTIKDKTGSGISTLTGAGTGLPVQATPTDMTFADIIDGTVYGNFMAEIAEIANSVFSWDPSKDQEYLNDAAIIENQVTQMMVGRGGLYSSVHQATLTTQLISLQVEMRKQKYDEYVADRNFKMNIIQTQWGMFMDQANLQLNYEKMKFDQAMQQAQLQLSYAKFKADREDAAWSKYMAEQEYKLKVSQANYAKEMATKKNLLSMQALSLKSDQADVGALLDTWANTGVIKPELRAYADAYGIELPDSLYYSFNSNEYAGVSEVRTAFNNAFSRSSDTLMQSAVALDDIENFASLYVGKSYLANQPTASGYSEDTDSATQKSNYVSAYNSIIGSLDPEAAATKILEEYAKGSYNFELKYGSGSSELLTQAQKALNPMYGA